MKQSYTSQRSGFLPPSALVFLKQSAKKLAGIFVLALAVLFAGLLGTYHPTDVSLNTTTELAPLNLLSVPGAYIADFFMQLFGFGSFFCIPIILSFGGCIVLGAELTHLPSRLAAFITSFIAILVVFGMLPNETGWLETPGWGGACGYLAIQQLSQLSPHWLVLIISVTLGIFSFFTYLYALGVPFHVWGRVFRSMIKGIQWSLQKCISVSHKLPHHSAHDMPLPQYESPISETENSPVFSFVGALFPQTPDEKKSTGRLKKQKVAPLESEEAPSFSDHTPEKRAPRPAPSSASLSDDYQLPSVDLLDDNAIKNAIRKMPPELLEQSAAQLTEVLQEFGVRGEIVQVTPGPVVTLYELKPAAGIKTSRVIGLADDIARSMSALAARIAVIPGRNVIGIELPNPIRETVYLRELLLSQAYINTTAHLPLILGKDIGGLPIIADMARMPHVLVAGTTGSGKSVAINTMIMSILFKLSPEKCRLIMIDPKMLELSTYDGIPHLLTPVVTDPKKAVVALKWAVKEMENRYRSMAKLGVRNIDGYNTRIEEARSTGEMLIRRVQTGFDPDSGKPVFESQSLDVEPLPYIIVIVDEMADLMLVAGKEIEAAVQRLAQMARAAGIHLVMATQRPSVDVITGTIKANFPTRISFQVSSKIDSRTILGEQGAEQLLGQGDMLYMAGGGRVMRVHGPFVRDDEVEHIVNFLKEQGDPTYEDSITVDEEETATAEETKSAADPLYEQAVELVRREGKASTSFVQRYLQIGYNRAARIIEQMEKDGHISGANHVGKREVLKN